MNILEFSESLKKFFSEFFGGTVENDVIFCGGGEFWIEGFLKPSDTWKICKGDVKLYEIAISLTDDFSPKPKVKFIGYPFNGGPSEELGYLLEDALVYIENRIGNVKSKAIYDNL